MTSAFLHDSKNKYVKEPKTYTNIKDALKNVDSVFSFSYSGKKLKSIPKDIYKLKKLKKLRLSNNYITVIDKEISNLKDLEELIFYNNSLSKLPPEFKELKKLRKLDLNGNQFKAIPNVVCNLDSLKSLFMLGNHIKAYPECIFRLKRMQIMDIENWDGKYEIDSSQLMKLRMGLPQTSIGILPPYESIKD